MINIIHLFSQFENFHLLLIFFYIYNNKKLIQRYLNNKRIYIKLEFHIKIILNDV